jgi:uncharacterized LabA/DUF88 family protein
MNSVGYVLTAPTPCGMGLSPEGTSFWPRCPAVPERSPRGTSPRCRPLARPVSIVGVHFWAYRRGRTKKRVVAFIDGYNLYHSVHELNPRDPKTGLMLRTKDYLKWVNLWDLLKAFVHPSNDELVGVQYFSAYATWRPSSYAKHRAYVAALKSTGVNVVMGQFKAKPRGCRSCKARWTGHEEKESDVNLALYLLDLAYKDEFDKAVVLTADTDILPAIRMVQNLFPNKEIQGLLPQARYVAANALKSLCRVSTFGESHLAKNLFPALIQVPGGKDIVRPLAYDPPAPTTVVPPTAQGKP